MARALPEWVGKTDDAKIPPRVRLRIWERCHGHCHLTGRKIVAGDKWDMDHIVALVNGGEHRESNLAPALRYAHREKTAQDVAEKSRIRSIQAKHINERRSQIRSRGFQRREKVRFLSGPELARLNGSNPDA